MRRFLIQLGFGYINKMWYRKFCCRLFRKNKGYDSGRLKQFYVAFVASIGVFGLGTVFGFSSPAVPDMLERKSIENRVLSLEEQSWVASIVMLGALISSPFAGFSVDHLGPKISLLIFCFPFILGWILISTATQIYLLLIGRFITGFSGGAFSVAAPIYISETSEKKIRGFLVTVFQFMLVSGVLFSYVVGTFTSWRILSLICALIPGFGVILIPFIPHTPRFSLICGKNVQAIESLRWLRSTELMKQTELEFEIREIENSITDPGQRNTGFRNCAQHFCTTSSSLLKPLLLSLSLMIFSQLSGFNAMIFYTGTIFEEAGTYLNPDIATIIVGIVQVIATVVSSLLVDKFGRRKLLIIPQIILTLALFALGTMFYIKEFWDKEKSQEILVYIRWLPLTSMLLFIVAYSIGIGPLSWIIMGEILPANVKGISSSIATSLTWLFAFVVTKSYDSLEQAFGTSSCFFTFAILSFCGLVSILLTIPETKGKSLGEIQEIFGNQPVSSSQTIQPPEILT